MPTSSTKTCLDFSNTNFTRSNTNFSCICTCIFQFSNSFRRSYISSNNESFWKLLFNVLDHLYNTVRMAMCNINSDKLRSIFFQTCHEVIFIVFDPNRNRCN
ncbi:hypothetical protein SAM_1100 [Streptococcus agalactiae CJB111]|nr:hypothetical protein SAM_1100 [Streptococcus agalactiae CJB111]